MKSRIVLAFLGLLCFLSPGTAHAGVPQWPQKRIPAKIHASIRQAPKPPRHDQVQRGGVEGSIAFVHLISTRRHYDERRQDRAAVQDSIAQVRASCDDADHAPEGALRKRPVDTLPAHWASTHLSI